MYITQRLLYRSLDGITASAPKDNLGVAISDDDVAVNTSVAKSSQTDEVMARPSSEICDWEFVSRGSGSVASAAHLGEPVRCLSSSDVNDINDEDLIAISSSDAKKLSFGRLQSGTRITVQNARVLVQHPVVANASSSYKNHFLVTNPNAKVLDAGTAIQSYKQGRVW
ncbi:uncharacterized protein B0I36DRAFT_389232 [Microdochium trichocladiopsis]|uniref:Uncharacterized protein n=1 Tax=Microdochium trichocladiopsis TaxID=1682393 RepID=A0A9P8XRX5_9PEZI|nr:uncharacterized protein B0I36DRAFT_389232 [Microdochium trichocladiopsis]KAH7014287.1 hypothetical protein B0I36DRAFT_389232 [Microdochium trichocladiopsis]